MKYTIEYQDTIRKINSVTIEVGSEEQGDIIADELVTMAFDFDDPDCIFEALDDMGAKVLGFCEGTEDYGCDVL